MADANTPTAEQIAQSLAENGGWGVPIRLKPAAPPPPTAEQIARETAESDVAVRPWGTPSLGEAQTEQELAAAEQAAIDEAFAPPATPAHYVLPHIPDMDPKADTALRGMLHAAELDQGMAQFVVEQYLATVHNKPEPSDVEKHLDEKRARVTLEQLWGDQTDAKLAAARGEVQRIAREHPAVLEILRGPLGNNPLLTQRLALIAELRRNRIARGKK